jgi:hypothetical protein
VEGEKTNPASEIRVPWIWGFEACQAHSISEFLGNQKHDQKEKDNGAGKDVGFSTSRSIVVVRLSC